MAPRPLAALFLCAMPMELRPLTRRLGLSKEVVAGVPLRAGELGGRPVAALATGMGTQLARTGTARALEVLSPAHALVFGITGAVDDDTAIGALMRPEAVIDAATGRRHRPGRLDDEPSAGVMWTTDVITRPDELPALRAQGVVCLDMETAAIAEVCEARDIPWSVHRVVSDRATDGSVDDEVFQLSHQDGTPDGRAVARYLLRHPHRIPGLVRTAKGARLATERAAEAAVAAAARL